MFCGDGLQFCAIPGLWAMTDYIMIDGFKQLIRRNPANMELLCRGMTFYGSVITRAAILFLLDI